MHLAAKFVETEVKELLKTFELTPYEKSVLTALTVKIIEAYEEYRSLLRDKPINLRNF